MADREAVSTIAIAPPSSSVDQSAARGAVGRVSGYLPGLGRGSGDIQQTSDDWHTPKWLLHWIGPIALDPCWSAASFVKAQKTFDVRRGVDGLAKTWNTGWPGIVFCNPPFSNCGKWLRKCRQESDVAGLVVVALVPAIPGDGPWHSDVWPSAQAIGFIKGRVKFTSAEGSTESKGRGHALIVYGPKQQARAFVDAARERAGAHPQRPVWVEQWGPRL